MKTAIFVYTTEQVEILPKILATCQKDATEVVAFGVHIELLLEQKNIPYRSIRNCRSLSAPERFAIREKLGREFLQHEVMKFFSYRDISLGALFTPALQYYLENFLYYLDVVDHVLKTSYKEVMLFGAVTEAGPAASVLEGLNSRNVLDATYIVCKGRDIQIRTQFLTIEESGGLKDKVKWNLFVLKRALFGYALNLFNMYVRIAAPRKKVRILASEYWKNISALMPELPEAELVLLDRAESLKIGLKNILAHRMQFVHSKDFTNFSMHRAAHLKSQYFKEEWKKVGTTHPLLHEKFLGHDLEPILSQAFLRMLKASKKLILDIDGTFGMIKHLEPQVVLVRASISAQTHFAVLCEVARLLHIPSVEIQHGIFSMGKETLTWDHAAEYIAGYGPFDKKLWEARGYAPRSKAVPVGSPRFDVYISGDEQERPSDGKFKVVLIGPQVNAGDWLDTYDALDHFTAVLEAIKQIPNAHLIIKLRSGDDEKFFFKETLKRIFADISYEVVSRESLVVLLPKADAVISCHSTAALEALLIHRPVILDSTIPMHTLLVPQDFAEHEKAGALLIARSAGELVRELQKLAASKEEREVQAERTAAFMRENYLFADGDSSQRLASFIRSLIQ